MAGTATRGGWTCGIALGAVLVCAAPAWPSALRVVVTGIPGDGGVLTCSLHDRASGFPASAPLIMTQSVPKAGRALCLFDDLAPGRYAVAVLHDANGNGRMDTNLLGVPSEAWGVSGRRSVLRAPRFDDAAFDFGPGSSRLRIRLDR